MFGYCPLCMYIKHKRYGLKQVQGGPKKCTTFTMSSGIGQQMKTTFVKVVHFFWSTLYNGNFSLAAVPVPLPTWIAHLFPQEELVH